MMGLHWEPIRPLSENWASWTNSELSAIRIVWDDFRKDLGETAAKRLHQRMLAEWSIETGMVEELYRWDRGVTETLLAHGFRADRIPDGASTWTAELVAQVLHDQVDTIEGLFAYVRSETPLCTSFIHQLHSQLLRNNPVNFERGRWKIHPNSVRLHDGTVHQYCPPEQVGPEIDRMLELNRDYEAAGVPVEIRAAWLHHRFTEIHPYPDGNGRTARALASLVMIQAGLFPLIVRHSERHRYFDVLETADRGDLQPFVEFIRGLQRRELVKMGASIPVEPNAQTPPVTLEDALKRVQQRLEYAERFIPPRWNNLPSTLSALKSEAEDQLNGLSARLAELVGPAGGQLPRVLFRDQETAESLGLNARYLDFEPRFGRLNSNCCLEIKLPERWRFVVTFSETAPRSNGLLGSVVFLSAPNAELQAKIPAPGEYFLITYAEPLAHIRERYGRWLALQLIRCVDEWNRAL